MLLRNTSFKSRMIILSALFLLGLAVTHLMYCLIVASVRVNGPLYDQIAQGKDLTADILPPPQYIIESYLLVCEMVDEQDPVVRREQIAEFNQLESEYYTRHHYWIDQLDDGPLKSKLIVDSYTPAKEFYRLVNENVIAPLESGQSTEGVSAVVLESIRLQYQKHRDAIDQVVTMANQLISDDEKSVKSTIRNWLITQAIFGTFVIVLLVAISWFISRGILKPTAGLIDRMKDMSEGGAI